MLPYFYFLKVIICSAIFIGYYFLALRNKVYHQYNRFYLLIAFALSWCIPVLPIKLSVPKETVSVPVFQAIQYISEIAEPLEVTVVETAKPIFTADNVLLCVYAVISFLLIVAFIKVLFGLYCLTKKYKAQNFKSHKIYLTTESNTPFSFFKHIFWNTDIDVESAVGKQILQHELTHIEEKHSLDKMYVQLNLLAGWFNPMFWLLKKELEMIHEFIADKKSVPNANTELFAAMLLNTAFAGKNVSLTNPFFFSPIKRRLIMLTKKSNPKFSYVQRIIALPIIAVVAIVFSLKAQGISVKQVINNNLLGTFDIKTNATETASNQNPLNAAANTFFSLKKKYKVVVDAGHGGTDKGAGAVDGTNEKDIALAFAKTIKELNNNDNIDIVLTRDNDVFMNPKEKAEFSNKQNADLFVSMHCMYDLDTKKKGTEIYTVSTEKNNGFKTKSDAFANYINNYVIGGGFTSLGIKTRKVGIWVLQATNCPSVLIEAGYISNADDRKMMKDAEKRKQFCTQVLNGIQNYLHNVENNIAASSSMPINDASLNDTVIKPTVVLNKTQRDFVGSGATEEEMQEYFRYQEQAKTNAKSEFRKYNSSKLSADVKDRMFVLFGKMTAQQQDLCSFHFMKPMQPFSKDVPTSGQISKWQNNKTYGIWIDEKHVANSELSKYKATDFSHYYASKLYGAAIKTANGRTVQIDLMTNNFYDKYAAERKKEKYLMWYRVKNLGKNKTKIKTS